MTSTGAIIVKSLSGGSYAGTQNPSGMIARSNQNAATQPPTVIISGSGCEPKTDGWTFVSFLRNPSNLYQYLGYTEIGCISGKPLYLPATRDVMSPFQILGIVGDGSTCAVRYPSAKYGKSFRVATGTEAIFVFMSQAAAIALKTPGNTWYSMPDLTAGMVVRATDKYFYVTSNTPFGFSYENGDLGTGYPALCVSS